MASASGDNNKNAPAWTPEEYPTGGALRSAAATVVRDPTMKREVSNGIPGLDDSHVAYLRAKDSLSASADSPQKKGGAAAPRGYEYTGTRAEGAGITGRSTASITASAYEGDRIRSLASRAPYVSREPLRAPSAPTGSAFIDDPAHESVTYSASIEVGSASRADASPPLHEAIDASERIAEESEESDDVIPHAATASGPATYPARAYSAGMAGLFNTAGYHEHRRIMPQSTPAPASYNAPSPTADALRQLTASVNSLSAALQAEINKGEGLTAQIESLRSQLGTAQQASAMMEARIKEKSAEQQQSEERLAGTIMELKVQVGTQLAELKTHRNLLAAADAAIPGFEQMNEYLKRFVVFHAGNKSGSLMSCVDAKDGDLCGLSTLEEAGSPDHETDPFKLALVLNLLFSCAVAEAAEALRAHQSKVALLFGAASDAPQDVEQIIRTPLMIRAWFNTCRRQFARVFDFRAIGMAAFESWLHDLPDGLDHTQFKDLPTSRPGLYDKLVRLAAEVAYLTLWCEVSDADFRVGVPLTFNSTTGAVAPIHMPYSQELNLVEIASKYRKTDGGYPISLLLRPREAGTFPLVSLRATFVGDASAVMHASTAGPLNDLMSARIGFVACAAPVREAQPAPAPEPVATAAPVTSTSDAKPVSAPIASTAEDAASVSNGAFAYHGVLHSDPRHAHLQSDLTKSAPAHLVTASRHAAAAAAARDHGAFAASGPAEAKVESETKQTNADTYALSVSGKEHAYYPSTSMATSMSMSHASGMGSSAYSATGFATMSMGGIHRSEMGSHPRLSVLQMRLNHLLSTGDAREQPQVYNRPMPLVLGDGGMYVYHPPSKHVIRQGKYDELVRDGLVEDYSEL